MPASVHYVDLYHLVKFLPSYALPASIPSQVNVQETDDDVLSPLREKHQQNGSHADLARVTSRTSASSLPVPATAAGRRPRAFSNTGTVAGAPRSPMSGQFPMSPSAGPGEEGLLLPARMPPKYGLFDLFPFSLLVRSLDKKGKELQGKKAARLRAKRRGKQFSHNIPLEISFYLVSCFDITV